MNPQSYALSTNKMSTAESATEATDANTENSDNTNNNQAKPINKNASKKDLKNDSSRFESPGINFIAKLIGVHDVESARGDKMCQESMVKLKLAVRQSKQHKQKIIVNVSLDGIRIIDTRTQATNFTHAVHKISFISRDISDNRAFGYVYGAGEGKHKFYAIKTEKAAEALVLTLRDLFQVVYEIKKKEVEEAKHKIEEAPVNKPSEGQSGEDPVYSVPNKARLVEGPTDDTYQVPPNNQPVVVEEVPDLLNLENEMEAMERRIEQIDTMEEFFAELEAPAPVQKTPVPASSTSASFANDLASLSSAMSPPTQPMFSLGGVPFGASPRFGVPQQSANPFGQPFGAPTANAGQPFGGQGGFQPMFPQTGFGARPVSPQIGFGGQPNMFQPPSVPPRAGPGFPGQPGMNLFPGMQQGFPQSGPPAPQSSSPFPQVASDPFGNDPFGSQDVFSDGLLTPARNEQASPQPTTTTPAKKDAFGDLVDISPKTGTNLKPKDMFTALATPEKKPMNAMKGNSKESASLVNDPFGMNSAFK